MIKVKTFTVNMFGVNTYVVWNPQSLEAAIIDPGMIHDDEKAHIDHFIMDNGLLVKNLINTHMHVDHIFGDLYIKNKYNIPIQGSQLDSFLGERAATQCRMFGLPDDMVGVEIDEELTDGQIKTVCGEEMQVMLVPGHSPGSIALYFPESGIVFTGDVLFRDSIGRTDLVAGNHHTLMESIKRKLFALPDSTVVYPGHGEITTIGYEKENNPYID